MDVVNSIRKCLSTWTNGGASECRRFLISSHCHPSQEECMSILSAAYATLLSATIVSWSMPYSIPPQELVAFLQSVLSDLPSSSSSSSNASNITSIFGEHLVDVIWSLDAELDETLLDARTGLALSEGQASSEGNASSFQVAKQNAESDKERIQTLVQKLLECGIIKSESCRERLDSTILANVGLILDKSALDKKEIRTRTALFYKQNKFNLLREQSEGYSKLIIELTSSLGPAHSAVTGRPTESYDAIEERARPVWEKAISLIGYFDLDPNRVLDIILDVFSVHLSTHYSFFLALLSFSPWRAVYRRASEGESADTVVDAYPGSFKGKTLDEVLSITEKKFISPPSGSAKVLAQVLGFKFAFYNTSDASESTPRNLYLTAAILIREGFITLEDLYPHLLPNDDDMDNDRKEYVGDVQARIASAKSSQLAMAAPLESSGTSSQFRMKPTTSVPAEQKRPGNNQKVGILAALLSVGALKPAIAIMAKFPWLVDAHTEIADLMIRILKESLSPLYQKLLVTKERNLSFCQPRSRYGTSGLVQSSSRKPCVTLWAPTPPSTSTQDFVFFFPGWVEQIPICSSLDDIEHVIEPLMRFVKLHISRDLIFVTKFLRLGRLHLSTSVHLDPETKKPLSEMNDDHPIRSFWLKVLRMYLLPALPLIRGNAVCTVEVWNIIKQYETTTRWRLYGEWKSTTFKSHPELRVREVQCDRESKGILRRLSHNTIDSLSGSVAKLAHSAPTIFFSSAVNQIMAYDNLAGVVVQALHYVTTMGFDVLVFVTLDALANPRKERVKDDGVNISDWLQSLASFIGMLFRRYSADITPVLRYIVHQLHNGQATEIVVLRELIWKMAGIEPLPSLSESQIIAMAGGPVLRIEAVASATRGARRDPADVYMGPSRLGRALLESSLTLPLLIQVAQQRQACVYKAPHAHLKSLAGLFDATHEVLLQYLDLLSSSDVLRINDYADTVRPPLADLGELYGICAPMCMQIIRPVLHAALLSSALAMQDKERIANEEAEKRLKAALTAKREPCSAPRLASPSFGGTSATDAKSVHDDARVNEDTSMDVDQALEATTSAPESPWQPFLTSYFVDLKKILPSNACEVVGPGFYLTFWQLSTYDLAPPSARYDEEGAALRALSRQEDAKYNAADRSSDRLKRLMASGHRAKRERCNTIVNRLAKEFKEQTVCRAFTMKRLSREKNHWFSHSPKALIGSLIEHCIQPRCLLSPMDADFCAQFIKLMHTQGTPGFHTLGCYDKLLGDHVKVVLFSCTEYEARNYGRFLLGILQDLLSWYTDENAYNADNRTKVGGKIIYNPGLQRTMNHKGPVSPDSVLKWVGYQQILRKWHRKLQKSFIDCIQTGEFMHVYNAIVVLKEILPVFPLYAVYDVGAGLDAAMDHFLETEERGDLKILGRAYSASLKKREPSWASPKLPVSNTKNGSVSPRPNNVGSSPVPEKPRPNGAIPSGTQSSEGRRVPSSAQAGPSIPNAPSAPRAQLATTANVASPLAFDKLSNTVNPTKLAMDSIPRPEVVKRVRPDIRNGDSPKLTQDVPMTAATEVPPLSKTESKFLSRYSGPIVPPEAPRPQPSLQPLHAKDPSEGPRIHSSHDDRMPHRMEMPPNMPPPSVPSQTASAQELRETARQSVARPQELRNLNGIRVPSPRNRSPSPTTRPGTRNPSADSRNSGGRTRSERVPTEAPVDERHLDREGRHEMRDHRLIVRRDSLTHMRSERITRDRTVMREVEKDVERDGNRRERRSGKEQEKERDHERDRDRDRDRHRRDGYSRKERDSAIRGPPSSAGQAAQELSVRTDVSRHRNPPSSGDDGLGKRRRPTDDDPERGSKRSSREKGHRDDHGRRSSEKEGFDRVRESDRRRKDRDDLEADGRGSASDKPSDKRSPEGPWPSGGPPPSTPLAPRAMSASDGRLGPSVSDASRSKDTGSNRDRHRDTHTSLTVRGEALGSSGGSAVILERDDSGSRITPSLHSRISKDTPLASSQTSSLYHSTRDSGRDSVRDYDDFDSTRKRSVAEREKEIGDFAVGSGGDQPTKRPRINRFRYGAPSSSQATHGIAKKLLPIDPSAGEKWKQD